MKTLVTLRDNAKTLIAATMPFKHAVTDERGEDGHAYGTAESTVPTVTHLLADHLGDVTTASSLMLWQLNGDQLHMTPRPGRAIFECRATDPAHDEASPAFIFHSDVQQAINDNADVFANVKMCECHNKLTKYDAATNEAVITTIAPGAIMVFGLWLNEEPRDGHLTYSPWIESITEWEQKLATPYDTVPDGKRVMILGFMASVSPASNPDEEPSLHLMTARDVVVSAHPRGPRVGARVYDHACEYGGGDPAQMDFGGLLAAIFGQPNDQPGEPQADGHGETKH